VHLCGRQNWLFESTKFITELGVVPSIVDLVAMYCYNNGVIAQAKEPRSHQLSKDILKQLYLIKESQK